MGLRLLAPILAAILLIGGWATDLAAPDAAPRPAGADAGTPLPGPDAEPHKVATRPAFPPPVTRVPVPTPGTDPNRSGCTCLAQDRALRRQEPELAGPDVNEVQEILRELGYLAELTGRYDSATEEAVKRFQHDRGLEVDGIVGPTTWLALLTSVPGRMLIPELLEIPPLDELPAEFIVVDTGLRTLTLYRKGRLFRRYGVAIGKADSPTPLGQWKVVHKARHWGGAFGSRWLGLDIPWGTYGIHGTNRPDLIGAEVSEGCIRMQNWAVEELYELVPEGTPVYIVGPVPVRHAIYRGEAGTDVMEVQRSLAALGLYGGNIDGWFGPATADAVRVFQERLGIDEGGRVGPRTLEALGLR